MWYLIGAFVGFCFGLILYAVLHMNDHYEDVDEQEYQEFLDYLKDRELKSKKNKAIGG